MSNRIHLLAQHLTGKASVEECSLEEVQHIVKRYPYYAPAQFLLHQKLKQSEHPQTDTQQTKAVLFYHNPLLFEYFISPEKFYVEEENLFKENGAADIYAQEPLLETLQQTPEDELHPEINTSAAIVATMPLEHEQVSVDEVSDLVTKEEAFSPHPTSIEGETNNAAIEFQQQNSTPVQTAAVKNIETAKTADELTFEPYHTVDYFASQGIKISQEEPKDKLGRQLKSFTAWLKTMKRLPAVAQQDVPMETLAEKKIETMAHHSVSESNVVTEAMAEVWAKQGNLQKAEETYNKLSLLNPSKRAYFAAKIDNLKQS